MEIREVEKTIRDRAGGGFTGKVVVRFVEGEIIACDVGSPNAPMRGLTPSDFAKRAVAPSGPTWRDYLTDEERQELAQAEATVEEAKAVVAARDVAWVEAERRWMAAYRSYQATNEQAQARGQTSTADDEEVHRLRAATNAANKTWLEARDLEGHARVAQTKLQTRIGARGRRRLERDQAPQAENAKKPGLRDRLKALGGKS